MGYSIAWIAVRGKTKDEVLSRLSLIDTGETDEANESPVSGAGLPGGAFLVFFNDIAHPATEEPNMERLSEGCEVLGCQVEEHAMASGVFMYANGAKVWEVAHLSDQGIYHLEVEGTPPDILDMIHAEMKAAQDEEGGVDADVDCLFEAPLMLASSFFGYRHDQVALLSGEELAFTELVPAEP